MPTIIISAIGSYLYFTGRFSFGSFRTQGRHVRAAGAVLLMPAVLMLVLIVLVYLLFGNSEEALIELFGFLALLEIGLLVLASMVAYILIADPANAPRLPGILGAIQAERRANGDQPVPPVRNRTVTVMPRGTTTVAAPAPKPTKQFGSVLSTKEAAEYMNVTEADILRWIDEGKLAAARINYMYKIAKSNLDDLRANPPTE